MTLDHLLAPDARLEKVASGFTLVEGPAWIPARGVLRFSDIPGNRVVEFSEADGRTAVSSDDAEFTNGRTLARDGSVIECSHGRRAVQIDRSASEPGADYAPEILVDRLDPADGSLTTVVIDVEASNGLAFFPDEGVLYVSDSSLSPAEADPPAGRPRGHSIHAHDVIAGRHAKNGRELVEVSPALPDGFRVDAEGNLWSSSLSGIQVFTPSGEKLGENPVPEKVANCAFGGADGTTLHIRASTCIYRIHTRARDAVADRPAGSSGRP
ncbi:SMP-30/gluconolactonase/LRE family protein [Brachybacterium paraconglomeratum]|uniref:SMP-30/gluconolactonase/LRE family protein n=1 Tax=Brachybacterium paraconglomeratum TaxID=173362 RepID=UPI00026C6A35|nr:SMP-30/gluconolactonase/LRE family protein [Brachybacterium paraconglomeratum]